MSAQLALGICKFFCFWLYDIHNRLNETEIVNCLLKILKCSKCVTKWNTGSVSVDGRLPHIKLN